MNQEEDQQLTVRMNLSKREEGGDDEFSPVVAGDSHQIQGKKIEDER